MAKPTDIKGKIRNLLTLAESPNEARLALLKARKLMAKHKLTGAEPGGGGGMIIIDKDHAERLESALHMAGAIRDNGTVNTDFGASLFILTGLPSVYDRAQQHIHYGWLDFEPMLRMALSGGEKILVALAGNLYNGSFFSGYTPDDIVSECDSDMLELAVKAILLRKQKLHYSKVCGVWYDANGTKDTLRSFTERKWPEIPGMEQEFSPGATFSAKSAQK